MSMRAELDRARAQIAETIQKSGWCVIKVGPGAGRPSTAYTIGLSEKLRHPELLMVGLDPSMMYNLLNVAAEHIRDDGDRFEDGGTSDRIVVGFPVRFRELLLPDARQWAKAASERYRPRSFRLIQIVIPDAAGKFPGDADCDPTFDRIQGMPGRPDSSAVSH